jgi:hypothetical protein
VAHRYPYFNVKNCLVVPDEEKVKMEDCHKKLLKDQFGVEV